jgi:isoquinoline 1-oxidoreductase beta subunit
MKAKKALKIEYEKDGTIESTADHKQIFASLMNSDKAQVEEKMGM